MFGFWGLDFVDDGSGVDVLFGVVVPSWGSCFGSLVDGWVVVVVAEVAGVGVEGSGFEDPGALDLPFALVGLLVVVVWLVGVSVTPSAEKGIEGSIFRITRNEAMTAVPPGK